MTTLPITFASLKLSEPIQRAIAEKNYTEPSPIQAQAIPHLLEGRDLMGCAQTGTGKTAAFALPILHRLSTNPKAKKPHTPRVLILTPTRELATQIGDNFAEYGKHLPFRHTVIFGGVGQNPQVRALGSGVEIVVATPGRLLDLVQQNQINLSQIEVFVLDEADRMLDMGFSHDVKRIIAKIPAKRQSLLFSATMPDSIMQLATSLLHDPVKVSVTPVSSTAERISQSVCHVDRGNKQKLLVHVLTEHNKGLVLVFSRTKHGANKLAKQLTIVGIRSEAIHGNKSQGAREKALDQFRRGAVRVLVATDIAARGIDVKGISMVINFDIPNEPEAYVHRIGRTARAGADGLALSLCEPAERAYLRDIQRLIRQEIPIQSDHPYALTVHAGDLENTRRPTQGQPQGRARRPRGTGYRGPHLTPPSASPEQKGRGRGLGSPGSRGRSRARGGSGRSPSGR